MGICLFDSVIKKRPLVSRYWYNTSREDTSYWPQPAFHSGWFLKAPCWLFFFLILFPFAFCCSTRYLYSDANWASAAKWLWEQVIEAWWRGWRWSSLLLLEQLAECFGAGKHSELRAVSQEPQVRLGSGQWLNLATPLQRPIRGHQSGGKSLQTWMFSIKELVDWIFLFPVGCFAV